MLQHLAKLEYELVLRETHQCLRPIVHTDQVQQSAHFLCLTYSLFCIFNNFQHVLFSGLVN